MENAEKIQDEKYDREREIKFLVLQILKERTLERKNKLKITTDQEPENRIDSEMFKFIFN